MSNLELPFRSLAAVITGTSALLIMNIVSVIGNILVCLAVYRNPNLRSTTNLYIIALAVSDLICATIEMPLASAVFIIGKWDFGVLMSDSRFCGCIRLICNPSNHGFDSV